jgi:hypothetical protein
MKIKLTILLVLINSLAWAAQIGDSVESKISLPHRIAIPNVTPVAVTSITLEDGVWAVDGLIDYFIFNLTSNAYVGASIETSVTLSVDGTGLFTTVPGPPPLSFAFPGLAIPGKVIEINGTGKVYLVGYRQTVASSPAEAQAWGFISARKIRNNH